MAKSELDTLDNYIIEALDYTDGQTLRERELVSPKLKEFLLSLNEIHDKKLFLKSFYLSVIFISIISFIYYYLVFINYFDLHIFILKLMTFVPIFRVDFISYIAILIPVTALFNYKFLIQKGVKIGYMLLTYPLLFIIMPGILDNFYIILFKLQLQEQMEIQFIFLDNLKIWQYQILSVIYTVIGLILLKNVKKSWHFFAVLCFAVLIYSSLIIRLGIQTFAYNISNLNYIPMWLGIDVIDLSFANNIPIYLGINFSIIIFMVILAFHFEKSRNKWWDWRF